GKPLAVETAAGRAFPFRFGGEPLAGPFAEPIGLEPGHIMHRELVFAPGDRTFYPIPGLWSVRRIDEAAVFLVGDLVLIHVEGVYINPVRGKIVATVPLEPANLVDQKEMHTAHPEFARRDLHHSCWCGLEGVHG